MAYDVRGRGLPLLLLHSGVCDRRMWEPQWVALAESFRVVRPDLRGFGETPLPPGRSSFAADVIELLDHLGIERTRVVGSSLGGRVAMELAAMSPERVERLVLLCPALAGFPQTADAEAFDEAEETLLEAGDVDGFVELNVSTWLGPEADNATRELVRVMQRRAAEVQIAAESGPEPPELDRVHMDPAAISAPTLVVSGGADMDQFQAVAAHLAETMPTPGASSSTGRGTCRALERPEAVTPLIRDFAPNSLDRHAVGRDLFAYDPHGHPGRIALARERADEAAHPHLGVEVAGASELSPDHPSRRRVLGVGVDAVEHLAG